MPSAVEIAGPAVAGVRGNRALVRMRALSSTADMTGRPHQKPSPSKRATNTGASAVPSPSSALRTSTERSTASGWKMAVKDGGVSR